MATDFSYIRNRIGEHKKDDLYSHPALVFTTLIISSTKNYREKGFCIINPSRYFTALSNKRNQQLDCKGSFCYQ